MLNVKLKILPNCKSIPRYIHENDAGMDISAGINEPIIIKAHKSAIIPVGFALGIPSGYEVQIRSRSGLAAKSCIAVLNSPGTVDSGYTGEIKVILMNHSDDDFVVSSGDRIAQMVFSKYECPSFAIVEELETTQRGDKGFGSTGISQSISPRYPFNDHA